MTTTTQLVLCPKCNSELPNTKTEICPTCRMQLLVPEGEFFGIPDYIWHQRESEVEKSNTPKGDRDWKRVDRINEELAVFARKCTTDDRFAALWDARLLLSHVLHTPTNGEDLSRLVKLAKSIGTLAESIDTYIKSGGELYDGKVGRIPSWKESASGSDEATS